MDRVGVQRGIDHGKPATLAVTHEVHLATNASYRFTDDGDIVLDRCVLRVLRSADPVQRQDAGEPGIFGRLDLALVWVVVDYAGIVSRLRRQKQRRDRRRFVGGREVS